jgi:hypothetical protein
VFVPCTNGIIRQLMQCYIPHVAYSAEDNIISVSTFLSYSLHTVYHGCPVFSVCLLFSAHFSTRKDGRVVTSCLCISLSFLPITFESVYRCSLNVLRILSLESTQCLDVLIPCYH